MVAQSIEPLHDVFLSHSHADGEWVERLARRLRIEHGFRIWLDRWVLVPGKSWQREMNQGLEQAHSCAVCINDMQPGGWFQEELERALDLQTKNTQFRVIPVLLPDADVTCVPGFLSLRTWADFRDGKDQSYAFHVLSQGIRGEPIGPWPPLSKQDGSASLSVHERKILQLQRFRTLGIHEEVVVEYERRILADWYHSGE